MLGTLVISMYCIMISNHKSVSVNKNKLIFMKSSCAIEHKFVYFPKMTSNPNPNPHPKHSLILTLTYLNLTFSENGISKRKYGVSNSNTLYILMKYISSDKRVTRTIYCMYGQMASEYG